MTTSELYERIRFRGRPVAHPDAVVTRDNVRFTVLTPRLIRLEWSETGVFEDRCTYAFPTRYTDSPPKFTVDESNAVLVINTGILTVRYTSAPKSAESAQSADGKFTAKNLSITFTFNGRPVIWRPGMPDPENLRGTRRTLDECEGDAALAEGLVSRAGWALFDDSRNVIFDDDGWVGPRPDFALQDWYFFGYGHDYKAAIAEYLRFGGAIPLIPRYILGGWWSRYWAYSEQDLRDLVAEFEAHNVPLDVFVIDMDWHTPDGWTGYTWNRELFPDPPAFLKWLHEKGLRVTLNLHPADGVHPHEEVYPQFAKALGIDPESRQPVPFRIADKNYVRHYFEMIHHPMEDDGVDFWWMDWQQGEISEVKGLDPLPWINHLHFNDIKRKGVRPMLYSRWGGLGNHRYYIGFSGDTYVRWTALQFQPYLTATAANVAYGWWSHDIGGHMGGATEPELYTRWVQFGALSPVLRLHATKDPRAERRPWAYPEPYGSVAMDAFRWRYRLIPYLYTMARRTSDTGLALCCPMYYEHPEADDAYVTRYQYYFGDQMIAAPVVTPVDPQTGLASTVIWLPEGTWIDYQTLETFTGPRWIKVPGNLSRMPMLMKAGAILPLAPEFAPQPEPRLKSGTTDAQPRDQLELVVFPGTGTFRLYEDDGLTEAYLRGQYEWTAIETRQPDERTWTVGIAPVEGHCDALPDVRGYTVTLRGCARPVTVMLNGAPAEWRYDAESLSTAITVPKLPKSQSLVITAIADGSIVALGEQHNWQVVKRDVECLLGESCGLEIQKPDDLWQARIVTTTKPEILAQLAARLGGPFAHFLQYCTPEEARRQLGHVVLAAPAAGEPYSAEIVFTLHRGGATETQTVRLEDTTVSHVIPTPFAADGVVMTQWEARVTLHWRDATLHSDFRSIPLFPAVPAWRAMFYDCDKLALQPADVLDATGNPNPDLPWETFAQDLARTENYQRAYFMRLGREHRSKMADTSMAAYLTATVSSPKAQRAVLAFTSNTPVEVYVNGVKVAENTKAAINSVHGLFVYGTRFTKTLRLRAGANVLLIHSTAAPKHHVWYFGAALLSPSGDLLTDVMPVDD
ncbi:MAG TPA: glycoside hydrolase family 31 protein [Anaerolineae bacterium]|nr:glycoside hydrolase family 31 protein [Anaerolineae bacterium]HQK15469.1 glycoside hydrolase family 31 protein [Anaerolineae bacterium]